MSAEILRDALQRKIHEVREKSIRTLRQCKYVPASSNDKGGVIPAATAEEIAFRAVECNTWIEACDAMKELIDFEARKILQPEQPKQEKQKVKELY